MSLGWPVKNETNWCWWFLQEKSLQQWKIFDFEFQWTNWKLVVIENITEEYSENPDKIYEEAIVNLEDATKIIRSMTKLKNLSMLNKLMKKHVKFLRSFMQKQFLILRRMLFLKILMNAPTKHLCILRQWKSTWKILIKKIIRHGGKSTMQLINLIPNNSLFFLKLLLDTVK